MKFELLIRNATLIDGTRAPRFEADIAVKDGKIVSIGSLINSKADVEIDASGKIAAPGFIDAHTHDDRLMLSAPDMAPKVSQGVTTVVAGNCGVSLAPAPRGMPKPVTPPLNLMDSEGTWFHFKSFKEYVEALRAQPPATNCALLVGHSMLRLQTMDDVEKPASPREISSMRNMVEEALGARRADRGSDRGVPAAHGEERHLLHAHARRGRPHRRFARGDLPHRARARRAGGDLAPQAGRQAEPRPLGRDAADHREGHALAENRPRLLSLLRLVHDPLREPRRARVEGAGDLVEAASGILRNGVDGNRLEAPVIDPRCR